MVLSLLLVAVLSVIADGRPAEECCDTKLVGSISYTLTGQMDTKAYKCLNDCIYQKEGETGMRYCFAMGDQKVECQDQEGRPTPPTGEGEEGRPTPPAGGGATPPAGGGATQGPALDLAIIITGGINGTYKPSNFLNSVDVVGQIKDGCKVAPLPEPRIAHVNLFPPDRTVLTCGGSIPGTGDFGDPTFSCLSLDFPTSTWESHSSLDKDRTRSTAVTLAVGSYIMGGGIDPSSSSFLPLGSKKWEAGPTLTGKGASLSCAVQTSISTFLLVGGRDSENTILDTIVQYSSKSKVWTNLSNLKTPRRAHACALLGSLLIVAGGYDPDHQITHSTEVYDMVKGITTVAGDTIKPRSAFGMAAGHFGSSLGLGLFIYGGHAGGVENGDQLASIEVFDKTNKLWTLLPDTVGGKRGFFGSVVVPARLICQSIK